MPEGDTAASFAEVGTETGLFELVPRIGRRLRHALGWSEPSRADAQAAAALLPGSPEAARPYAEGLNRLRALRLPGRPRPAATGRPGRPRLGGDPLPLSLAWIGLGDDAKASEHAEKAVQLSVALPKEERLAIEARAAEARKDRGRAGEIYRSLWTFYPDNPEYGLRLATALVFRRPGRRGPGDGGGPAEACAPAGEDPRIDLAEAQVAKRLGEPRADLREPPPPTRGDGCSRAEILAEALMLQGDALLTWNAPASRSPATGGPAASSPPRGTRPRWRVSSTGSAWRS